MVNLVLHFKVPISTERDGTEKHQQLKNDNRNKRKTTVEPHYSSSMHESIGKKNLANKNNYKIFKSGAYWYE